MFNKSRKPAIAASSSHGQKACSAQDGSSQAQNPKDQKLGIYEQMNIKADKSVGQYLSNHQQARRGIAKGK